MKIFLNAKHWQLFLVLFGTIVVSHSIFLYLLIRGQQPSLAMLVLPVLLVGGIFFGWLWAVATACFQLLPPELAASPKPMQFGLFYALLYLIFSGVLFFASSNQAPAYQTILHLLAMAALFYAMGFTAKQLVKLEKDENVSLPSYLGTFVLIWIFPIGVWLVQPKVNYLLDGSNS